MKKFLQLLFLLPQITGWRPWQDTVTLRQEAAPLLSPGQSLDTTPSSTQNKRWDQCPQPWDITGPSAQAPPHPLSLRQSCSQAQPGASHTGSGHRDISPRHKDRTWGNRCPPLGTWPPRLLSPSTTHFSKSQFQPPFLQPGPTCPPPDLHPLLMGLGCVMAGPAGG